jgi:hypothetical protein
MRIFLVSRLLQLSGMELSPGTAGTWVNIVRHEKVVPVVNLLNDKLFSNSLIFMDETFMRQEVPRFRLSVVRPLPDVSVAHPPWVGGVEA